MDPAVAALPELVEPMGLGLGIRCLVPCLVEFELEELVQMALGFGAFAQAHNLVELEPALAESVLVVRMQPCSLGEYFNL